MIVWKDYKIDPKYSQHAPRVIPYMDFFNFDLTDELADKLAKRMGVQRPGHAISYVYFLLLTKVHQWNHWQPKRSHAQS